MHLIGRGLLAHHCNQEAARHAAAALDGNLAESAVREALIAVGAGAPLSAQSPDFQDLIAMWQFVPTDESSIERHHARVSVQKRRSRNMGPVAVSLSNRWQAIEDMCANSESFDLLLQSFSEARQLHRLPAKLGIEGHPMMRRCLALVEAGRRTRRASKRGQQLLQHQACMVTVLSGSTSRHRK